MATKKVKAETLSGDQIDREAQEWGKIYNAEEKVSIRIPQDPLNRDDDTVPVCVNGYNYFIKRGVTVEVPRTIAEILERAQYI